uniref:NADH-ubiquinone oxidoreductase chain 3 n=1 Tax=Modiolus philippinarum TaxID=310899 RepID=A0A1Z2WWY4_9BIVA|nr:NADH dehydrogenase subunit 3 [Modiolus philippinarum]ASB29982.1 NADH dehydrogenase subunit 3 [Modiolus philippinarum]
MILWLSILIIGAIPGGLFIVALLMNSNEHKVRDKSSPYECGFETIKSARSSFSMRFFLLAVMFVVFDVEVVMLVPIVFSMYKNISFLGCLCLVLFFFVLIVGCLYERRDGSMDWIG